jgi:hypothetical protein
MWPMGSSVRPPSQPPRAAAAAESSKALSGPGSRLAGVAIGHYVDWNLYRIVYMVGIMRQDQRVVEEWRLAPIKEAKSTIHNSEWSMNTVTFAQPS